MSDPIDIREPVFVICERLGLEPNLVAKLELTPRVAKATIYLTDDDGAKFIDPETNDPASRVELFKVST